MTNYFYFLAIAVDQLINALLGGYPDETLSARAHRLSSDYPAWAIAKQWINLIFFLEEDHCQNAHEEEEARKHSAKEDA